ncbi:MAG: outer membrane lipoprotein-sorting protein [Fidelibacterota bacterium]
MSCHTSTFIKVSGSLLLLAGIFTFLSAQTGYEIAKSVDERPEPKDMKSDMTMILTNSKGQTRTSTLRMVSKDGGKKQILWFISPADDKGVSFLKIEHDDKDDELRLWLPAFKKVRRISANKKSEAFMGSDLSYEDMTNRDLDENDYQLLKDDELILENHCYVLQTIPRGEAESEYSKHVTWIAKDGMYPVKEESYDSGGKLLKAKTFLYKKDGDYWVPSEIYVENIQKIHNTRLNFENIRLDTNVDDGLFQEKNLKRIPRD